MDKDIVIKRKLNITIQSVVVLSLCILFFLWPLAWAIKDFESFMFEFENNGILLLICIAIGIPILVCTLIVYVKCLLKKYLETLFQKY